MPTVSVSGYGAGDTKYFPIDFPQSISWQCTINGHTSLFTHDYGYFAIWDGSGAQRVYRSTEFSLSDSGSFLCDAGDLGTGRISVWGTNQYSGGSGSATYIARVQVATVKLRASAAVIVLPVFQIGTVYKDGLRISTPRGIACFELVAITDAKASPLRVMTPAGIKAIYKG